MTVPVGALIQAGTAIATTAAQVGVEAANQRKQTQQQQNPPADAAGSAPRDDEAAMLFAAMGAPSDGNPPSR